MTKTDLDHRRYLAIKDTAAYKARNARGTRTYAKTHPDWAAHHGRSAGNYRAQVKIEVLEKTEQTIIQCQDFLYNSFFGNFLRIGLSSAFILIVTYNINHKLFFVYVAILSVGLYTNLMFGSRISSEEKKAWKIVSDCQAVSLDVIQNVKEVKIFCNEDFEIERRKKLAESQLVPLKRSALLWRSLTTIENLWQNFGFGVAMFPIILPMAMDATTSNSGNGSYSSFHLSR